MTETVNVVAFVETPFTENVRDRLQDKMKSFELAEWAFQCIETGENKDNMRQLVGVLVNEVFAQRKMIEVMGRLVV
ncbi:hypothetical protein KWH75_06410 [Morganella morganii]|uniref:hypothetical protein n=1 Tax=Morganella morganii TaxID=582 RepID=UPI0021D2E48F|nr:hypothetical protein [Morganella morganii]MCU6236699.1 hypothetical protein [Morganella morganii]